MLNMSYNISFVSAVVVFPGNFDFDIWGITSLFSPSTTIYGNNWSCEKIIRNNRKNHTQVYPKFYLLSIIEMTFNLKEKISHALKIDSR